jgi:hypothetical protein
VPHRGHDLLGWHVGIGARSPNIEAERPTPQVVVVGSGSRRLHGRSVLHPSRSATICAMINSYLRGEPDPGLAVFRARLGLTVVDLAAGTHPDVERVAGAGVRVAMDGDDA